MSIRLRYDFSVSFFWIWHRDSDRCNLQNSGGVRYDNAKHLYDARSGSQTATLALKRRDESEETTPEQE